MKLITALVFSLLILFGSIGFITIFTIFTDRGILEREYVYMACCNSSYCSDTYYTKIDNKCHLTMCEHLYGRQDIKCTYGGDLDAISKSEGL
jgi:hypothetical protein